MTGCSKSVFILILYLLYTMFLYMSAAFMSYENMDRPVESVLLYISAERVMIGTCEAFFMLFITAPASFFSPRSLM